MKFRSESYWGVFLRLAALATSPLDRLSRYEYLLWRQARQLVLTLECMQRRKRERRRPTGALFEEFK